MTTVAKFDWPRPIREESWDEFNSQAKGTPPQLANADLRMADLRGLDRSEADLHGASRHEARISGVFFPANLAPEEIRLSVLLGTRMRTRATDRVPS
jgi:uncharacterized protein YjbI with pentapeptide repeats